MSFSRDNTAVGVDALTAANSHSEAGVAVLPQGVPLLFIDASSPLVQAGLWQDGRWLAHRCADAPALEEIFRSVAALLAEAKIAFCDIGGFIHNEGPGSILGIRLAAMALRVWADGVAGSAHVSASLAGLQPCLGSVSTEPCDSADAAVGAAVLPVWVVRSLPLVAAKVASQGCCTESAVPCAGDVSATTVAGQSANAVGGVFSEFRQGLWNWFTPNLVDVFGDTIEVIETEELEQRIGSAQGSVLHLRHRKSWETPTGAFSEADGDLGNCPQVLLQAGLLRRVALPEALLTRAPEFKTASGERHRGSVEALRVEAPSSGSVAQPSAGSASASHGSSSGSNASPSAS